MGNQKPPQRTSSNVSSAANPAAFSTTQTASRSSILRSSFSPYQFQRSLFASVIQGLDAQHLRIHDTVTGRLRCEHAIAPKATITCLDWGYYGESRQDRRREESTKKRKRSELVNGATADKDVVLALGTSQSDIEIFSPAEAKVVATLKEGHTQGIKDFKFVQAGLSGVAWSIGGDGRLVQWDLRISKALRTLTLPYGPANTLRPLGSSVLCASHLAYIINPTSDQPPSSFNASTNPVHTIVGKTLKASKSVRFLTAAENDHFINVFDETSPTLIGSLRTEDEVVSLDFFSRIEDSLDNEERQDFSGSMQRPQEALAVIDKAGLLKVYPQPFDFGSSSPQKESESLKARMKQRTRKAAAQIKIARPDKGSSLVPVINASFQGSRIAWAWVEGGVNVIFDTMRWRDAETGEFLLKETNEIIKAKSGAGVGAVVMNGVKNMGRSHVDESRTIVANGGDAEDVPMEDKEPEVINISSGEEESDFEDEEEVDASQANVAKKADEEEEGVDGEGVEKDEDADVNMKDALVVADDQENADAEPDQAEEPSFGDLLRANAPEAVDVQASFADPNAQSLVPTGERGLHQLPSGMSLGTVLTQSLRTNDSNLLETCFHTKDLAIVRATIERLDFSFATILLQKLAERLHSRPGRAGSLMVWIQWTLVAHGGYLAGQPEVMKKLASLHRVVKDRASSLQPLLSLKGKLDMLEAQMNMRKTMQERSRAANADDEDDEEGVIYVEGQEESDSEEEESEEEQDDEVLPIESRRVKKGSKHEASGSDEDSNDEDSGNEMPTTNGIIDSEDEEDESDGEGLIDDEASSTNQDSDAGLSENEIDHESIDTDSSDANTSPPPKRPAKSKLSNGIKPEKN